MSDWHTISIRGQLAVDFVGRFESIEEDPPAITSRLGPDELATTGISTKKSAGHDYRSYYDEGDAETVTGLLREEVEAFDNTWSR